MNHQTIPEVQSYKYLEIQIDSQLRWKEQTQRAIAKATKWLLQYRRLTRPSSGTNARLMHHLNISVALVTIFTLHRTFPHSCLYLHQSLCDLGTPLSLHIFQLLLTAYSGVALHSTAQQCTVCLCTLHSPIDSRWTPHIPHNSINSRWSPGGVHLFW